MSQVAPYKFYRRRLLRMSYYKLGGIYGWALWPGMCSWNKTSAYGFWAWLIWRATHYRMRNGYFRCIVPEKLYHYFRRHWRS